MSLSSQRSSTVNWTVKLVSVVEGVVIRQPADIQELTLYAVDVERAISIHSKKILKIVPGISDDVVDQLGQWLVIHLCEVVLNLPLACCHR